MRPFNRLFVLVYYVVGLISRILHPTSVEGMEKLPQSGVLLCPNHSSNWDPILVALRLPVNPSSTGFTLWRKRSCLKIRFWGGF